MLLTPSLVPLPATTKVLSEAPVILEQQVHTVFAGIEIPGVLFGGLCLMIILVVHGFFMAFIYRIYESRAEKSLLAGKYWHVETFFYCSLIVMMLAHIIEIAIWAWFLTTTQLVNNFHKAMVFSGSTYTTVGFGQDLLPSGWEIITVVIAMSGMFAFAWTTSLMISMMGTYRAARIARRTGKLPPEYRAVIKT